MLCFLFFQKIREAGYTECLEGGFKTWLETKKKIKSFDEKMKQKAGGFVDDDIATAANDYVYV